MARSLPRTPRQRLFHHLPKLLAALAGVAVLAGGAYVATRKSPDDHLKLAVARHQSGDFKGAEIELKNTLQAAPDNADARFLLGRIHFANGDYPSADKELKKARELGLRAADLDPWYARTLLLLNQPRRVLDDVAPGAGRPAEANAAILALRARAQLLLKDVAAAETSLADADASAPGHPETLAARAFLAFSRGHLDDALGLAGQAVAKAPRRADLWVLKGDLLHAAKRNDEALQAYAQALAAEPGNIPARLANAQLHLESAALDKAEADLKALRKLAPDNLMGRYLEALVEFHRGNYAESNNKLQTVLRAVPNFMPAHLLAGVDNLSMGNREQAKSHFNKVLEVAPDHPLAHKLMAATLMGLGQAEQAKELLTSLRDTGTDPMLYSLQGVIALRQGDFAEASKNLEKATRLTPDSPKLYMELAASRMGGGDTAGAIEALTKAAELDPASTRPGTLLVLAHVKNKQYDAAFKVVDEMEKSHPNSAFIHNLRGGIQLDRGDAAQARASFSKALQSEPGNFPAAASLARMDIADKNPKAARARFEQVLQHAPKESRAWVALASLAASQKDAAGYLKNLDQAKRADGKNVQARQLLVRYWLGKKQADKALSEAREALDATGRPEFQELIGIAQVALGDHANALATFARWAEASPDVPMAHFRLAQAQITAKDRAAALKSLDKALALRPDFTEASLIKAILLGQEGHRDEAVKIAREVQKRLPNGAEGYLAEAEILSGDKQHLAAAKLYAKAAQLTGRGQPVVRAFQSYAAAGQAGEGEEVLAQWLQSHPDDVRVRHQLALAQLNGKRLKEAEAQYALLARANAKDLVAFNNLAWLQGELKNPAALATAEHAFNLSPDNPATLDTLGWLLVNAGQSPRGLDLLRKALSKSPDAPEIHWHLAAALAKTGDRARAKQELERLFAAGLAFPQEKEARRLLDSLQ